MLSYSSIQSCYVLQTLLQVSPTPTRWPIYKEAYLIKQIMWYQYLMLRKKAQHDYALISKPAIYLNPTHIPSLHRNGNMDNYDHFILSAKRSGPGRWSAEQSCFRCQRLFDGDNCGSSYINIQNVSGRLAPNQLEPRYFAISQSISRQGSRDLPPAQLLTSFQFCLIL